MNTHDALLAAYLDGTLNEEQQVALRKWLKEDCTAMRRFTDVVMFEEQIRTAAQAGAERMAAVDFEKPAPARTATGARWHALLAAAAGLVLGLFSASMVFGYVLPQPARPIPVLDEGFESGPAPRPAGMPRSPDVWSGDFSEITGTQRGVKPAVGEKMLRILRADYEGKPAPERSYAGDLFRIVDLRPFRAAISGGTAMLRASAAFNAALYPAGERYGCSVAVFALTAEMAADPATVRDSGAEDAALAMARKCRPGLDRDPATWQRLEAELVLPAETEFLLMHVSFSHSAAGQRRPEFEGHFLDDIRVSITPAR